MAVGVDLNGILDFIKTTLDAANTTTGSPIDLSESVTSRVKKVLTVNPKRIPMQASYFPAVTCWISDKESGRDDIAKDQLITKRQSEIIINIAGMVFNQNMSTNDKDPSDRDINYLMENIELILRSIPNINSKVSHSSYSGTKYYSSGLNAQTHLSAGIITLTGKVFY